MRTRRFLFFASALCLGIALLISFKTHSLGGTFSRISRLWNWADKSGNSDTQASASEQYDKPGVRFDSLVREDFFAGMLGDDQRLARGMKLCDQVLAKHPHHAEALVWHGGGLLTEASAAYARGEMNNGDQLFNKGLEEMNDAVRYEPDNMGVRIGRAATLIGISQSGFDTSNSEGLALLKTAVNDYEDVLRSQENRFSQLPMHNRGELLFGLASGWSLLGNREKAKEYLLRITRDCKGSSYEAEARSDLQHKTLSRVDHECRGCHVQ